MGSRRADATVIPVSEGGSVRQRRPTRADEAAAAPGRQPNQAPRPYRHDPRRREAHHAGGRARGLREDGGRRPVVAACRPPGGVADHRCARSSQRSGSGGTSRRRSGRPSPTLGDETIRSLDEWGPEGFDIVSTLLAELGEERDDMVLVLDDVHLVVDDAIVGSAGVLPGALTGVAPNDPDLAERSEPAAGPLASPGAAQRDPSADARVDDKPRRGTSSMASRSSCSATPTPSS